MSDIKHLFNEELLKFKNMDGVNKSFIAMNGDKIQIVFSYIFVINYFKNKVETKSCFRSDYNITFSLLLESSFALLTGQCRSALLLLRSAQESNFRFVLEKEREYMLMSDALQTLSFEKLDYRFLETKRKFLNDLNYVLDTDELPDYFKSIERNYTLYRRLSGVVHSESKNIPVMSVDYFSRLYEETIIDHERYFKLFCSTLNEMFLITYFMLRNSLKHWDSFILFDLLRIIYGKKRSQSLVKLIKNI